MTISSYEWGKSTMKKMTKRVLAMMTSFCLLAGTSITASAETVVWDFNVGGLCCKEEDGTLAANKWVHDDFSGLWFYFEENGLALVAYQKQPCPILPGPDGTLYADARVRSATGQPGQQPIFSMPSAQRDLRYKGLRQTLDSMPLYPDAATSMPELDAMLDNIFSQIITPDMDTHDKLKACYDYLICNIKDSRYEEVGDEVFTYEINIGPDVLNTYNTAYVTLLTKIGVCDNFSATFATMAWKLGLPMYIVGGSTTKSGGGYTPHAWCQMDGPDGTVYVFDPHIDYLLTLRGNGALSNARFGPTQAQVAGKYAQVDILFDYD